MKRGGALGLLRAGLWLAVFLSVAQPAKSDDLAYAQTGAEVALRPENKASYLVTLGEKQLGNIDVFIGKNDAFVPLDAIMQKFGGNYYRDDDSRLIQINFLNQTSLTLNFGKNEYIEGGVTKSMQSSDFIINGTDIFVNYEFLNKTFPYGFSLDRAAKKLNIIDKEKSAQQLEAALTFQSLPSILPAELGGAVSAPSPEYKDMAPAPLAAPRIPVIIDDLLHRALPSTPRQEGLPEDVLCSAEPSVVTELKRLSRAAAIQSNLCLMSKPQAAEIPQPAAPPAQQAVQPATKPAVEQPQPQQDAKEAAKEAEEENLLVLQPKIKKYPPSDLFIEALDVDGKLFVPLADMMQLLEFDIKVDAAKGTAQGTFITPQQEFSLDLKSLSADVDHKSYKLTKTNFIQRGDQIYIDAEEFNKWFGIKPSVNRHFMFLVLDTDIVLPMEARLGRHNLWNRLLASQAKRDTNFVPVENPYQPYSWPFMDFNLSTQYTRSQNNTNSPVNGNYTVLGSGDLGYMTTNVYASGNRQQPLDNVRVTSGRKDQGGELLGPLQARAFSFGDVESPSIQTVTNDSLGRGVLVTNRDVHYSNTFDTHTFIGDAVPGWEIELYRNNLLLAFQTADANGRYEFKDIPLIYGSNVFRIVLYGPQGQTEERVETIEVGSSMLKPDQFEYTFSVNQKEKNLIDLSDNSSGASTGQGGLRAVNELRYGVSKNLTVATGLAQTKIEDGNHRYATATMDGSMGGVFTEANMVKDVNGGWMSGVTALTSFYDISVRARHRQFDHFVSEAEDQIDDPRVMDSEIDMNGQFYAPVIQDYNYGLKIRRETFMVQVPRLTYSTTFSKSVWGVSLSNSLSYIRDSQTRTTGIMGMQSRIYNILFRFDGSYEFNLDGSNGMFPAPQFKGSTLTTQYRLTDDLGAQTRIDRKMDTDKHITLGQTFNWDLKNYRLSLNSEVNSNMEVLVGLSLVFSLAHDEVYNRWRTQGQGLANSGAIASRIFVDDNYNSRYDEGETILPDARLRINRLSVPATRDSSFLAPVSTYDPINVDLDPLSLKDPMMSSAVNGFSVTTRPGDVVALDFPVISTSNIDGNVGIVDETGKRFEIPDIVVELVDQQGMIVQRIISESDGYFIFQKVHPGEYTISIPAEALAEYKAELVEPPHVKVEKSSDFYSGNDIYLKTKTFEPPKRGKKTKKTKD